MNRITDQLGEWQAYVKKNPQPDGLWWPLKFDQAGFADVARTHPAAFGVWREKDGTYTVSIRAEAKRQRLTGWKLTNVSPTGGREIKRGNIPDLLELRTYLLSLAN
jgi:hypothetical protein